MQRTADDLTVREQGLPPAAPARRAPGSPAHLALAVLVTATLAALAQRREIDLLVPLAVAGAAWVALLIGQARSPRLGRRTVLGACGILLAAAVAFPPRQSSDVWAYSMYGRIAQHYRLSPYRFSPAAFAGDPWFPHVSKRWRQTRSVYGPAFTLVSAGGMALAGDSPLRARLFFQLLGALGIGGSLLLIDRRTRDPRALAWLGLNPLVVVSVVNGGHNDALCGLAVLGAVMLADRGRGVGSGAALALGALVKLSVVLPAAAVGIWVWRRWGILRAALMGAAAAAVLTAGYALAGGTVALGPLRGASRLVSFGSVWDDPRSSMTEVLVRQGMNPFQAGTAARDRVAVWAMLTVLALAAVLVAARLRDSTAAGAAGAAGAAYLLGATYILPWYAAWTLPAAALEHRSAPARTTAWVSWMFLLGALWLDRYRGRSPHVADVAAGAPVVVGLAIAGLVLASVARLARRVPSVGEADPAAGQRA